MDLLYIIILISASNLDCIVLVDALSSILIIKKSNRQRGVSVLYLDNATIKPLKLFLWMYSTRYGESKIMILFAWASLDYLT